MQVEKLTSKEQIRFCTDSYGTRDGSNFIPVNLDVFYKNLLCAVKQQHFVRAIFDNDQIIAWAWFVKGSNNHSSVEFFQQLYYWSNQTGIRSARCVRLLHEAAIEEAKKLKLPFVISMGSHMDEENVFTRLLEKYGWERRGHTAVFRLPQERARLGVSATFLSR